MNKKANSIKSYKEIVISLHPDAICGKNNTDKIYGVFLDDSMEPFATGKTAAKAWKQAYHKWTTITDIYI